MPRSERLRLQKNLRNAEKFEQRARQKQAEQKAAEELERLNSPRIKRDATPACMPGSIAANAGYNVLQYIESPLFAVHGLSGIINTASVPVSFAANQHLIEQYYYLVCIKASQCTVGTYPSYTSFAKNQMIAEMLEGPVQLVNFGALDPYQLNYNATVDVNVPLNQTTTGVLQTTNAATTAPATTAPATTALPTSSTTQATTAAGTTGRATTGAVATTALPTSSTTQATTAGTTGRVTTGVGASTTSNPTTGSVSTGQGGSTTVGGTTTRSATTSPTTRQYTTVNYVPTSGQSTAFSTTGEIPEGTTREIEFNATTQNWLPTTSNTSSQLIPAIPGGTGAGGYVLGALIATCGVVGIIGCCALFCLACCCVKKKCNDKKKPTKKQKEALEQNSGQRSEQMTRKVSQVGLQHMLPLNNRRTVSQSSISPRGKFIRRESDIDTLEVTEELMQAARALSEVLVQLTGVQPYENSQNFDLTEFDAPATLESRVQPKEERKLSQRLLHRATTFAPKLFSEKLAASKAGNRNTISLGEKPITADMQGPVAEILDSLRQGSLSKEKATELIGNIGFVKRQKDLDVSGLDSVLQELEAELRNEPENGSITLTPERKATIFGAVDPVHQILLLQIVKQTIRDLKAIGSTERRKGMENMKESVITEGGMVQKINDFKEQFEALDLELSSSDQTGLATARMVTITQKMQELTELLKPMRMNERKLSKDPSLSEYTFGK